jgi:hypothetical protein
MRDLENARFIERFAYQLQTDRQAMTVRFCETAGQTDSADSGQVRRDGEDIGKIHLQRICSAFT